MLEMTFPLNLGNEEEFVLVYKTYYHPLKYFLAKTVGQDEAEDLLEDIFVKIWKVKHEFQHKGHLQAFLYRAAANARIDYFNSHRISKTEPIADQDFNEIKNYELEMVRAELLGEVYRVIHQLPSQCQKVIRMSYIEGLSNEEIAKQLGINEQSVKNNKFRGLKILRGSLSKNALLFVLISSI